MRPHHYININYYLHHYATRPFARFSFSTVTRLPFSVVFGRQRMLFFDLVSKNPVFVVLLDCLKFPVVFGLSSVLIDLIVIAEMWSLKSGMKDLNIVLSFYLMNSSRVQSGYRFLDAVISLLFSTIFVPSHKFKKGIEVNWRSLLLL